MRAIASVSSCHWLAIVVPVADIRARPRPAPDLSTSRTRPAAAPRPRCHRIKRILTLLNARELARLPYLNGAIVSHSVPSDILRWVIRYDTVRLFLHFRVRFFPGAAIVHLSISLANASKRLIMRCGASATRFACCDSNHPPEEAERHSAAHKTRMLYSTTSDG